MVGYVKISFRTCLTFSIKVIVWKSGRLIGGATASWPLWRIGLRRNSTQTQQSDHSSRFGL